MPVSLVPDRRSLTEGTLRVLTFNIYGVAAAWEQRRSALSTGLGELAPDLIALHETVLKGAFDQAADLLGDHYQIVNSRARLADSWGASIASRWPIGEVRELDQHVTSRAEPWCTTLIAEILAPAPIGPLLFVNHFQSAAVWQERERELQAVAAARAVAEMVARQDRPVVLAGDLNAEPDAASLRFLTGKQSLDGISVCYRNAWDRIHPGEPGHTFTRRSPLVAEAHRDWPYQRIDHILVRYGQSGEPSLDIRACELAFDEPIDGNWASDHFGLVADLGVPARS